MVVVAAGNEKTNACFKSPAGATDAYTVGATEKTNVRATFSNYGACVDIFAPGVNIRSASHKKTEGSVVYSGTSMAAPLVGGDSVAEPQLYLNHPS